MFITTWNRIGLKISQSYRYVPNSEHTSTAQQFLVDQILLIIQASRSYSVRHTKVDRIPLDERSAQRRDLYLTTHNNHNRCHNSGGTRTRNPSKRAVLDSRLRRCGHWDRHQIQSHKYTFLQLATATCQSHTQASILFIHINI
jgi:hypothetical protein